jgi:hypothetical protein
MGFASKAARAAAFLWARKNVAGKKSGRTWSCCGLPVEVDHLRRGCDGNVHPSMGGSTHSGEVMMTPAQARDAARNNRVRSMRQVEGGFLVVLKKKL